MPGAWLAPSCYSDEMSAEPPKKSLQQRLIRFLLYANPYLFIAYVLSVGPMYWRIYDAYAEGSGFLKWFYKPLVWASEIPYVSNFFEWYLQFWV